MGGLFAGGSVFGEPAIFLLNAIRARDVGRGNERDKSGGGGEAFRDVLFEVSGFTEVVFVDPDVGSGQESIECWAEPIEKTVDPLAIIAMSIADEHIVLEAWNKGHGRNLVYRKGSLSSQGGDLPTLHFQPVFGKFAGIFGIEARKFGAGFEVLDGVDADLMASLGIFFQNTQ